MKKILITGGLGLLGANLANNLKDEYKITVIDNLSNSSIMNACEFERAGIEVLIEDVRRRKKACKDFDLVFHCSEQSSVKNAGVDMLSDASSNILGTIATLKNYPTKKFIYFSSNEVYGNTKNPTEEDRPDPESAYGISKMTGEMYVRCLCTLNNMDYLILRVDSDYKNNDTNILGLIQKVIHLIESKKCGTINLGGDDNNMNIDKLKKVLKIC